MKYSYCMKIVATYSVVLICGFARNLECSRGATFVSEESIECVERKFLNQQENKEHLLKIMTPIVFRDKNGLDSDVEVRKRGGFLLTGVIVYQATKILGYTTIWTAAGLSIAGAFVAAGPPGAGAAYLNAVASIGPALAAVESASLAIGTAASWIPGLP